MQFHVNVKHSFENRTAQQNDYHIFMFCILCPHKTRGDVRSIFHGIYATTRHLC